MTYNIEPIGFVKSCFSEKFGIPRQALLAPSAKATLILHSPYNHPDCVAGLEEISHLWLTFVFHQHLDKTWKPKVRPPRLGGNQKHGVFATRSSFRPNHLGLSVVKLEKINVIDDKVSLLLSGVDLLDGTPVVDIKPYVPYVDTVPEAENIMAGSAPVILPVSFSQQAISFCQEYQQKNTTHLQQLITEVLQQDPRPAYHKPDNDRVYGVALYNCNICWQVCSDTGVIEVLTIE